MRNLFILQGAPGSGKTQLTDDLSMRDHTLSYDTVRDMIATTIHSFDGPVASAHPRQHRVIMEFLRTAAAARMHYGETLFIDAVHSKQSEMRAWAELAQAHDYRTFLIDVQGDITDPELLERNAKLPDKDRITEEELIATATAIRNFPPNIMGIARITPDKIEHMLDVDPLDASSFDEVVIVGDVQGCGDALERMITEVGGLDDEKRLWVFAGDLFDRGTTPNKVLDILGRPRKNVLFVEGNHERSVRETLNGVHTYKQSETTVNSVDSKKGLRNLIARGVPAIIFDFGGKRRLVTHGGVDPSLLDTVWDLSTDRFQIGALANADFMVGTNERVDSRNGFGTYVGYMDQLDALTGDQIDVQYFGHRNENPERDPLSYERIRPLESEVEAGGVLTAVVIRKDGTEHLIRVPGENPVVS